MASETVTPLQAPSSTDPMESIKAGLGTGFGAWRAFAVDLPLRIATETVRFTGCRLQAQADHLAALTRCGSLKDAFELQTAFLTRSIADYQAEARTLSHEVVEAASAEGVSKAA